MHEMSPVRVFTKPKTQLWQTSISHFGQATNALEAESSQQIGHSLDILAINRYINLPVVLEALCSLL
jgi:hypothetical protein